MAQPETDEEARIIDASQRILGLAIQATRGKAHDALALLCTAYALGIATVAAKMDMDEERQRGLINSSAKTLGEAAGKLLSLPPAH